MADDPEYDEANFRVNLGHIYSHLNRAWNARNRLGAHSTQELARLFSCNHRTESPSMTPTLLYNFAYLNAPVAQLERAMEFEKPFSSLLLVFGRR